jgi:hypothetical protein
MPVHDVAADSLRLTLREGCRGMGNE